MRSLSRHLIAIPLLSLFACASPKGDTGETGPEGPQGDPGAQGPKGDPGEDGDDAVPCAVADNGDGTMTITCPGSDPVTVSNGDDGEDGQDGQNGQNGAPGADGEDGTSCSATDNGDGSQTIDCTDGTHVYLQPPPTDPYLDRHQSLPGLVATVVGISGATNADGTFASGDRIAVTFRVQNAAGKMLPLSQLDAGAAWVAGPVTNYQHILPVSSTTTSYTDVRAAAVYNGDGTYTYTLPDGLPVNFGKPLFDTGKFSDGELTGPLTAGTYTVALNFYKKYWVDGEEHIDTGHIAAPILLKNATTVEARAVVAEANCARCHDEVEGHGGRYVGVDLCVTCHHSSAEDRDSTDVGDTTPVTIDFKVMAHKIHNAAHLPSVLGVATNDDGSRNYAAPKVPYIVGDEDFSAILYPAFPNFSIAMPKDAGYSALATANRTQEDNIRKGVTSCDDCHGDPDGTGPAAAPAQGVRAYTASARAACGSCHDDLDYNKPYTANGQTMGANLADGSCVTCHTESSGALSVRRAHQHPILDTTLSPEVVFNLTGVTGGTGANGKLQAGDRPVVQFTLKRGAEDAPITDFTSLSLALTGPTTNRQVVMPGTLAASPIDFAGRLASSSTANKGSMGKIVPVSGTSVSETIVVEMTSATDFKVTGTVSGALGTGSFGAATSTYPSSGVSFSNIVVTNAATAQNLTVEFSSATDFQVKAGEVVYGTGKLPASKSTSARFSSNDKTIAFNLAVGTTEFVAGDKLQLTVFKTTAANPLAFGIIVGRVAFATGDRFYYDYLAPAATYSVRMPMDLPLEYLGKGDGTAAQALVAANTPVWYGRQTLFEQTAQVATATALTKASTVFTKFVWVGSVAGLANNDYIVFDQDLATQEYAQISAADAVTGRVTLRTPLRWPHAANASVREVTLTYRHEGTDYTLDGATGAVTLTAGSTNAFVMTYRTDGRFGWKRSVADTMQTLYYAPIDSSEVTDETWGDWRAKPIVDGTYTFALWGFIPLEFGAYGEWQTYRGTTKSSRFDVLYGAATTVTPYALIESGSNCATCHNELSFHGGGREGGDTCFLCHGTAGPSVHFNTLLHGAHVETFPVMPNGAGQCTKCHGDVEVFEAPTNRNHPTAQGKPVRDWSVSCTGCHSWPSAVAHADVMTAPTSGVESCETCHGMDGELAVRLVHQIHE